MRYMMIVKSDARTEAGALPTKEIFDEMGKYNEELMRAGCMLMAEGLHPTSKGFRVRMEMGEADVDDGPFAMPENQIAGFWLIKVSSRQEAIDWAMKCPIVRMGGELELRQVMEMSELPPEILASEAVKKEARMREELQKTAAMV